MSPEPMVWFFGMIVAALALSHVIEAVRALLSRILPDAGREGGGK